MPKARALVVVRGEIVDQLELEQLADQVGFNFNA